MLFMYALALLRGVPSALHRAAQACETLADELIEDAPGFWKKHRAKFAILLVSAATSGVLTYLGERLTGPL